VKVNFVVAGTQKGGTTALDTYLRENPSIQMASEKEVHFFDNEDNFNSTLDYSKYHLHFKERVQKKIRGESTPIYMYWKTAPKRIHDYNAQMKFIIILRSPIKRAYSHWNMERSRGAEILPFSEAIRMESFRCKEALPLQHRVFSYIDRGFYSEQLKRIWRFFPRGQTLLIRHQDLKRNLNRTLSDISHYLEIPDFPKLDHKNVHSRAYLSTISTADFEYLMNIYDYEIKELEALLEWDCSDWLKQ